MHGPKRIYQGKRFSTYFWILMMLCFGILLIYQVATLIQKYVSNPTVTKISSLTSENGMDFPMVTMCNFKPVKKSYIQRLNTSGDFSDQLLNYLMESLMDTKALYGNVDRAHLDVGDRALRAYQESHPNFTILGFFDEAGFNCSETMVVCMFGLRQFDCCRFIQSKMTNMGKCHSLDLRRGRDWMQKQIVAGVNGGLQIILDPHMEEQLDSSGDYIEPIPTNAFDIGFRYYVHAPDTIPYLVSEGISVSPGVSVYSAIFKKTYVLLPPENWGNCTDTWPPSFSTTLPYSLINCNSLCNARFFYERCGCSPFMYNIDYSFPMCTPYQSFRCIDQYARIQVNGSEYFNPQQCQECKVECNRLVYHVFNSYGHGLSREALGCLNRKNIKLTKAYMRSHFLTLNVFFRDMAHTEYRQVLTTSLTETLGEIGGTMGMFLGMSLITVTEISLFISKIGWIAISKRRRDYLYNKKKREQRCEKQEAIMARLSMICNDLQIGVLGGGALTIRLRRLATKEESSLSNYLLSAPVGHVPNSLWLIGACRHFGTQVCQLKPCGTNMLDKRRGNRAILVSNKTHKGETKAPQTSNQPKSTRNSDSQTGTSLDLQTTAGT
ncbi:hypothetical protein Y032_0162g3444 [Ancylostoma ceylanicum]|uniref:Amiloride-sensitive sodium channel n=1 Tax=Ancylostoma ceylanicum TaxID=53326 RepID=A0A016SX25_9BILA|nr:hypothetical protein Y032_0162g3444 [Ancylostoma ceylanicum]